jgi:hypothetical protein
MHRVASICLALCMLCTAKAGAQSICNGVLTGTVVSVSKTGSIITPTLTLYTTPKTGHFVLTQVGSSLETGVPSFSVTKFGPLGSLEFTPTGNFQPPTQFTFSPGLALPPGASIQCTVPGGRRVFDCYMTGVLGP